MTLNFDTNWKEELFLFQLDKIVFNASSPTRIKLVIGTSVIFDETLTPVRGKIELFSVRDILKKYFDLDDYNILPIALSVHKNNAGCQTKVYYSNALIDNISVNAPILTSSYRTTYVDCPERIAFREFSSATIIYNIHTETENYTFSKDYGLQMLTVSYATIFELLKEHIHNDDFGRILSYRILCTKLNCDVTYSVNHNCNNKLFILRYFNALGAREELRVNGLQNHKTKYNKQLSKIHGKNVEIDSSEEFLFEVETSFLTANEVERFRQMFISPRLWMLNEDDESKRERIYINEVSFDRSDDRSALNSCKFSYKYEISNIERF